MAASRAPRSLPVTPTLATNSPLADLRVRYPFNGGRGSRYANGKPIDWPKCDLCGRVMDQVDLEFHVASFFCPHDGFTLSFPACRFSDRYCAWEWLMEQIHPGLRG
jgi:hypothetical protein